MTQQPIADALLRQIRAVAERLPAPRVRRLHLPARVADACDDAPEAEFCGLELDDGAFGLSFLLLGDTLRQLIARYGGAQAATAAPLAGADTLQLAAGFASQDAGARALGLAAINALTQSAWRRLGWQPPPAGNSVGDMALSAADHLGMIGCFTPLVEQVLERGARLSIVELDAAKVAALQQRFPDVQATLDRSALAGCNQVVGTSTMLLNDTLDEMLAACSSAREFALIGPSAGLWPDALFARGVTRIAGTQVVDGPAFADAMARGERWGHAARKFAIGRAEWPGWQALLARSA